MINLRSNKERKELERLHRKTVKLEEFAKRIKAEEEVTKYLIELQEIKKRRSELRNKWLINVGVYPGSIEEYSNTYGLVEEIPMPDSSRQFVKIIEGVVHRPIDLFDDYEILSSSLKIEDILPSSIYTSRENLRKLLREELRYTASQWRRTFYPMNFIERFKEQGLVAIVRAYGVIDEDRENYKRDWIYSGIPVRKKEEK